MKHEVLLGNEAIALGLVEQGCRVATAYPGTPSSEILAGVIAFKKRLGRQVYTEWSVNEKVAFEIALAASWTGLRAAVAMKQVGLNVAADPLFSAAYLGVKGGLVVIPADDPGPYSSQTEQDSRLMALSAKVPVLDPSSPAEARAMVEQAYDLSERFGLPVILRPTTRLCHARQSLALDDPHKSTAEAVTTNLNALDDGSASTRFIKDPSRWAATPGMRYRLHIELNDKLRQIEQAFATSPLNYIVPSLEMAPSLNTQHAPRITRMTRNTQHTPVGIIASGVAFHTARQTLLELGAGERVSLLKIGTPYPLPREVVGQFMANLQTVVVLEEPDTCIELQVNAFAANAFAFPRQTHACVRGRLDGTVPSAGELSPEVISGVLVEVLADAGYPIAADLGCLDPQSIRCNPAMQGLAGCQAPGEDAGYGALQAWIDSLALPVRRPSLCPGCAHRSTFFAIKREFGAQAIFPGDIGCYTLGINLQAVDTCVDMGASISMASGFYQANRLVGDARPIVATIGDSTFLHAGLEPLVNAVHTGARFVLVILDNHTTAMTGFQPTAASERLAQEGDTGQAVSIADLVRACGVTFVQVADPYARDTFGDMLRQAYEHTRKPDGGVAVVIAERPCVLLDAGPSRQSAMPVLVTEACDGCGYCVKAFECPALVLRPDKSRVDIDERICVACGQCVDVCAKGCIVPQSETPDPKGCDKPVFLTFSRLSEDNEGHSLAVDTQSEPKKTGLSKLKKEIRG